MNWSRTKTWLIVLFVGINLFLLFTIAKENIVKSTISEQMVTDTIAILAKNGIAVEPQTIVRKMPDLSAVQVQNTVTDQKAFAQKLLGGKGSFDAQHNQYMYGTSIVRFEGDTFSYININPIQKTTPADAQSALEIAKNFCSKAGLDLRKAQSQVYAENASEVAVLFTQKLDRYPLLDSQIKLIVNAKGVREAIGCWFDMTDDQTGGSAGGRVKEITSVLIDFISDENRAQSSTQITDITLGYTTGDKSTYHKSASAMPSWRITTADGRVYYYDAN